MKYQRMTIFYLQKQQFNLILLNYMVVLRIMYINLVLASAAHILKNIALFMLALNYVKILIKIRKKASYL